MKVIILCGGQGTRLREETEYRPKPLVEIGSRPILWHIMKSYAHYDFRDFVLCLGYRGQLIKEYFLNYEAANNDFTITLGHKGKIKYYNSHPEKDFTVTLADTGLESMTGSRVKQVERHVDSDIFLCTYGDGVSDINIKKLVEFHKSHGRLATMTTVQPFSRFGVLKFDKKGKVVEFSEKPKLDGWINVGFFVFDKRVFEYLDADPTCVLEQEPLTKLVREGQLMAFRHDGFYYAMDTYREHLHLNEMWKSGKAPWKVWL